MKRPKAPDAAAARRHREADGRKHATRPDQIYKQTEQSDGIKPATSVLTG